MLVRTVAELTLGVFFSSLLGSGEPPRGRTDAATGFAGDAALLEGLPGRGGRTPRNPFSPRASARRECGEADLERTDASCGDPTASMPPWCHWAISVRVFLIVAESMPFGFEMSTTFSGVPVPALGTLPLLPPGGATVSVPLMPEQSSS